MYGVRILHTQVADLKVPTAEKLQWWNCRNTFVEQHSVKSCRIANVEVSPASCGIAIMEISKKIRMSTFGQYIIFDEIQQNLRGDCTGICVFPKLKIIYANFDLAHSVKVKDEITVGVHFPSNLDPDSQVYILYLLPTIPSRRSATSMSRAVLTGSAVKALSCRRKSWETGGYLPLQ
jgi:hypothetical protein